MPPPFKPMTRSDSVSDEQQVPQLVQRTNSDGVTSENHVSKILVRTTVDPIPHLTSQTTRFPPALQPLKVSSSGLKTTMVSGQPGPRSVFFTTTKFVGAASVTNHAVRANSPTTVQTAFVLPQTRGNEKQIITSISHQNPPTLLFRPTSQQVQSSLLTQQQINLVKGVHPPQLQSHRPSITASFLPPELMSQQTFMAQSLPRPQNPFSDGSVLALHSVAQPVGTSLSVTNTAQTVSVIKQQAIQSVSKDPNKPFTSITDILSGKEVKAELIELGE